MPPEYAGTGNWTFLATTNRDLEAVAIAEIAELTGAAASVSYPGMVRFTVGEDAVYRLHAQSRSLHRVMFELARGEIADLADITELVGELDLSRYLDPEQSFAVRAKRRGDHAFGSPDVEREVGQAIIDSYRQARETRPPVDLDDPDCIFRIIVREDTATVALDATGQRSLHRRWYRVDEHEAALRPTIAYAMCYYANYGPDDRLVDPMCGCGTIPIEAALAATGRSPTRNHDPALTRFPFLDAERYREAQRDEPTATDVTVAGYDIDTQAIEAARRNARDAGVEETITLEQADATTADIDADVVVTDLPFGIRTNQDIRSLYTNFFENLAGGDCDRLVVHTAREDLVPVEVSEQISMRRGRLETSILVIE